MRIRIATTRTFPEGMASTLRIKCYAKALHEEKVSVEIISSDVRDTLDVK